MRDFTDRVAAITGAGSGMGRALALEMGRRGCHVALSDVDPDGLEETVLLAKRSGVEVSSAVVDVADRGAVEAWADDVVAHHGRVNLIFNNAGVALAATVEGAHYEDLEWILGINLWGVVHGTKAFLPHLKAAGEGHVVNTSSVFGLAGIPSQSAYNATKFAVRGFTEALRIELDLERCGVSATAVHPGGIKTAIARRARIDPALADEAGGSDRARDGFERLFITSAEEAARQIVVAVQKDKRRAMIGPDAHVFDLLVRTPPGVYQRLIGLATSRARR
jgi:NAD(P)-dependent dehydrogenase (short-subunit alcohol dehydrogenase family)